MLYNLKSLLADPELKGRIRTAHMVADLGNGGQERQLYNLLTNLPSEYLKLVIPWDFQRNDKYVDLLKSNESVIVLDLGQESMWAKVQGVRTILKETNAAFLHSYSFHLNFVVWFCALFLKVKAIGGVRSRLVLNRKSSGFLRFYLSLLFPFNRISNNYSCFNDLDGPTLLLSKVFTKTKFVHNGIDTDTFSPILDSKRPNMDRLISVSVGRLYPMKRVEQIIDWVHEMRLKGYKIYHQHAGEGPEMNSLKVKLEGLGLGGNFKFLGNVSDVPRLFAASDLFVHAAQYEGCPNVTMEAMSCGLAILSSDAGDTSFIVDHDENGFVFDIGDREGMLKYGIQLVEDRALLKSFGRSGAQKAKQKFGVQTYVDQLKLAYREIGVKL